MHQLEISTRLRLLALMLAIAAMVTASSTALGQFGNSDQLSKILTDPDKLEELKKERLRAPLEIFRSQVVPNDVLPYIKANHWSMISLEMRANHENYEGSLQSRPVTLAGQPHEMIYRRDALLVKSERRTLTLPILLPTIPKELGFQLVRPEAIRQDEEWLASLKVLEPHQQMVVVMCKAANEPYTRWSSFRATLPTSGRKDDPTLLEKLRYYRMVLPLDPDKPLLSTHPLTWSPISHVIWDGLPPENLGPGQQKAMLDWLHWGGQLIVVGGAGPAFEPLRESFLERFLPAETTGENVTRSGEQLTALSEAYPPPATSVDPDDPLNGNISAAEAWETLARRYKPPAPIRATASKPIFITALKPKPGATVIPLGGPDDPPLAVEWRVGRGRVLMTSVALTDPDLAGWPGFDTMVRRVVLRRPEERIVDPLSRSGGSYIPPRFESLAGPDLTTVRYLSRDMGAPERQAVDEDNKAIASQGYTVNGMSGEPAIEVPVGEWLDTAELPTLSRDKLEQASGIEIPGRLFVLKVILAYILTLVPLNWLICRYVLGRKEWAWVVIPTLSLAFAIGVERAAAYDVGFDSSCDEIDLLETQGDYPRGHISRFASIYSTGRIRYSISYPNDPTALALPLATGRSLRGEDATQSSFQTLPVPALTGFQVQPRSLALFRAEQLVNLPGTATLATSPDGVRTVANDTGRDLKEVWVIELNIAGMPFHAANLGEIAAGQKVPLGDLVVAEVKGKLGPGQLDPGVFQDLLLKKAVAQRPEEVGELRLIAWSENPMAGQVIEPAVDRHRGFTLVVAHLQVAPLLGSASIRYNALATGAEKMPAELPTIEMPPGLNSRRPGSRPRTTPPPQAPVPVGGAPGGPTPPPPPPAPAPTPPDNGVPATPPAPTAPSNPPGTALNSDPLPRPNATEIAVP